MGDKLRIWLGDVQKVLGIRRNVQHAGQREMDLELKDLSFDRRRVEKSSGQLKDQVFDSRRGTEKFWAAERSVV